MKVLIRAVRREMRLCRIRRKFPLALLHDHVIVDDDSRLARDVVLFPGVKLSHSTVGPYTYIQTNTTCFNAEIGPFCSIASNVTIGLIDHPTRLISTSPVFYDNAQPLPHFFVDQQLEIPRLAQTTIGADVWVGQDVLIKAGLHIGTGAVIGAGAVITHDVEPYTIMAGVPARQIRRRFADDLCNRLLASQWWKRSDEQLIALSPHFADPAGFLQALEAL